MKRVEQFDLNYFSDFPSFNAGRSKKAVDALEHGRVLLFPKMTFELRPEEQDFLTHKAVSGKSKNVSYDHRVEKMKGDAYQGEAHDKLKGMLHRFSENAQQFLAELFPQYVGYFEQARTSYRPVQVVDRDNLSARKDDRRLHVDAFPANPNQGRRILRIFANIHPENESRVWRVGDSFENVAKHFLPLMNRPLLSTRLMLRALKITKSFRTEYDALMLKIHDQMKMDEAYQKKVSQETVELPAGATWMVFTDQASHAAMSGQFCLEQTFYLPVEAMVYPERSPLKILEKLTDRVLVKSAAVQV